MYIKFKTLQCGLPAYICEGVIIKVLATNIWLHSHNLQQYIYS